MLELADKLRELKEKKDNLKKEEKELNEQIRCVEEDLVEEMINKEVSRFDRNGKLFYIRNSVKANANPGEKEKLYEALKDEGFGDLVYETVNARSFNSFVKEQMEENDEELPEWLNGLVNVFEETKIGIRKM